MTRSTLFDRLNQELEAFGKKAQAALDEGKVHIELLRARRRRDNSARDLGLLVYRRERGGEVPPSRVEALLLSLDDPVGALQAVGATTLWQEWQQVDQELVRQVHAAGAQIIAWTVNEVGDIERLARLGVDGLCGNYPDRIRVALAARDESPARA